MAQILLYVGIVRALPPLVRFLVVAVALNLAILQAFRAVFFAVFGRATDASFGDLALAAYIGAKFDLRLVVATAVPPLLIGWWVRRGWVAYFAAVMSALALLHAIDLAHFEYLRERLNATVLEHVRALEIGGRMVWESYPVVPALLALGMFAAAYVFALRRLALPQLAAGGGPRSARGKAALALGVVLAVAGALYGKWSWYPLRWSDAYFSPNAFVSALATNPVLHLVQTLPVHRRAYDVAATRASYDFMAGYLSVDAPDRDRLSFERRVRPRALERPPSVVIVFLESFAAFKAGVLGNALEPTPEFDALAERSVLFTRFFVPRPPTARSIFTVLFGIPDVSPIDSASRNPLIVRQHTIVNAFEGYEKLYFLGGSASWGNIRGMLSHNIPGLRLHEEGSYRAPRTDVWGVSDLHLLEEANEALGGLGERPFIAFIQTAGNHRPYTIPEDRRGFVPAGLPDERVVPHGFQSSGDHDAMRFMDFAIGNFFRAARKQAYYERTIFVLLGDHGTRGAPPSAEERLGLTGHQVPCIIHAPGLIAGPLRIDRVASSVDVLPTVASLAGVPHVNTTLGKDLLARRAEDPAYAFIDQAFRIGIIDDRGYREGDPLAGAFHETSRYMLYHNEPRSHR